MSTVWRKLQTEAIRQSWALRYMPGSTRPGWMRSGNCAGLHPDIMFPEGYGASQKARRVCDGCPVRLDCLHDAYQTETIRTACGVRGGLLESERRALRRTNRKVV